MQHCPKSHMIDNGYDVTAGNCPIFDLMHCADDAAQVASFTITQQSGVAYLV